MDQANRYLTQAIVGRPERLRLGVAIQDTNEPVLAFGQLDQEIDQPIQQWLQNAVTWASENQRLLGGGAAGLALGLFALMIFAPGNSGGLQLAPPGRQPEASSSVETKSIAVQQAPFPIQPASSPDVVVNRPAESARAQANAGRQDGPLPIQRVQIPASVVPLPGVKLAALPPAPVRPAAPMAKDKDNTAPKAVVLDASKPLESGKAVDPVVVKQETAGATAKKLVGPDRELGPPQFEPARVTLVDIARDGSFVLITNPQTRLPERFAVGQMIHTGEVIQKIEFGKGKVQIGSRVIGMQ